MDETWLILVHKLVGVWKVVLHPPKKGLVWFGLVWFYGISTLVGYSMPNPVCTYKKHILLITFLKEHRLIFFCVQLNGFKRCYVTDPRAMAMKRYSAFLYGVWAFVRENCVTDFFSDFILRLFYFYPTLSCWCNSLNKKAPKKLYERTQQQIWDEDVFCFFFPLFPGFNNHSMGEGIFTEYNWNGWIPQSSCLKIR